jgi:hypothetical protein
MRRGKREPREDEPRPEIPEGVALPQPLSWVHIPRGGSQQFRESLPVGPLVDHLTHLHAMLLALGAEGDLLAVAEHSLKEIAVFTQEFRQGPYQQHVKASEPTHGKKEPK